jgi:hypothetical protein
MLLEYIYKGLELSSYGTRETKRKLRTPTLKRETELSLWLHSTCVLD